MGCISSKVMVRSASYRQEMKWGSSRGTAGGTQALPGDVLIPRKGSSNHFLALVCTATTMTEGHRSGSFKFEPPISANETGDDDAAIKPHQVPLVNKDQSTDDHKASADPPKRSRSWRSFPSDELSYASTERCTADNGTLEVNDKGAIRSRSFHTVEDYDRLLERIWHATLSGKENGEEESEEEREKEKETLTSPIDGANQTREEENNSQETTQSSQGRASLVGESNASNKTMIKLASDDKEDPKSMEINILGELSINEENVSQERPLPKGFKRKSMARGLDALKIPSTFELPAVASLREWIPEGQVFSPEFGSYLAPSSNDTNKPNQKAIFNDELVFAIEEQLQHLKAEEEDILKQIISTWEVSGSTGVEEIATS